MSPLSSSLSAVALLSLALSVSGQDYNCKTPPASLANLAASYPPTGQIATILPNDTEANALFKKMSEDPTMQKLLRVSPKGSADGTGNFKGFNYDGTTDPDCWWTYSTCMTPKAPGLVPDISTCNEASTWGLTFDDGPYCGQGRLLDFLDQNNQKATFFLIGANVLSDPVEAQDLLNRGHEICGHTWSHHYTTSLSDASVFAEIYYTKKIIKEVTGVTTRCWRAPYGDVDDRVRAIAAYLDSRTVLWDQDTNDWSLDDGASTATIQANFAQIISTVANSGHGTIVLDHSISEKLIDMFISQYPKIAAAFKNVMPALSCANWTSPYYETNISYPDFATYAGGNHGSDHNASVSLDLNGGQLLFGNVTDQLAVPAPVSSSSASVPAASPTVAGAGANVGSSNKSTGTTTGAASHVAVWSFSALFAAALGSLVVAA